MHNDTPIKKRHATFEIILALLVGALISSILFDNPVVIAGFAISFAIIFAVIFGKSKR